MLYKVLLADIVSITSKAVTFWVEVIRYAYIIINYLNTKKTEYASSFTG